jgi:ABC-type Fe3+/spermidine/putrescine transport system ATPase subunit
VDILNRNAYIIIRIVVPEGDQNMTGVEIDFVVTDSLKALDLYERIVSVQRIEVKTIGNPRRFGACHCRSFAP